MQRESGTGGHAAPGASASGHASSPDAQGQPDVNALEAGMQSLSSGLPESEVLSIADILKAAANLRGLRGGSDQELVQQIIWGLPDDAVSKPAPSRGLPPEASGPSPDAAASAAHPLQADAQRAVQREVQEDRQAAQAAALQAGEAAAAPGQAVAQPAVNGEDAYQAAEDEVWDIISHSIWPFIVARDFLDSFRRYFPRSHFDNFKTKLVSLATGQWQGRADAKRIGTQGEKGLRGLALYRMKLTDESRILFEVLPARSKEGAWMDHILLWAVEKDHDRYERVLIPIAKRSFKRRNNPRTKPILTMVPETGEVSDMGRRKPHRYTFSGYGKKRRQPPATQDAGAASTSAAEDEDDDEDWADADDAGGSKAAQGRHAQVFRPTSLLRRALKAYRTRGVPLPLELDPDQEGIVEMGFGEQDGGKEKPIILKGRSGTGKTTCIAYRMWQVMQRSGVVQPEDGALQGCNILFISSNHRLVDQVKRDLRLIRQAWDDPPLTEEDLKAIDSSHAEALKKHRLADVPPDAFPLFITSRHYLHMLEGSLPPDLAFFKRDARGGFCRKKDKGADSVNKGWNFQECELTHAKFVRDIWPKIKPKKQKKDDELAPDVVWTEICSHIKGSLEAVESPNGCLSLEGYLALGRKRALANFGEDARREVYAVFLEYQAVKRREEMYDLMDLVYHLYVQLHSRQYRGPPIHALFRDEVQDFLQAELAQDLLLAANPNALFYAGDSAQTITRGVHFRFAEVTTMFRNARERYDKQQEDGRSQPEQGGAAASSSGDTHLLAARVEKKPHEVALAVNYRTHQGILDPAALVVDLIQKWFSSAIDTLERERAEITGVRPLLLGGLEYCKQDLIHLLSDTGSGKVEMGADQAIIVRNEEAKQRVKALLPVEKPENVNILTVNEVKGLEFDDIIIVDFFKDSLPPPDPKATAHSEAKAADFWKVINHFLEHVVRKGLHKVYSKDDCKGNYSRLADAFLQAVE